MKINNVEHLKKFKDIKEIEDISKEIKEIEKYQQKLDVKKAEDFLNRLRIKYIKDLVEYNAKHPYMGKNLEEISQNIFTLLRKADKYNADLILIEGVEKTGLGLAIMNRLIRACAHEIIET